MVLFPHHCNMHFCIYTYTHNIRTIIIYNNYHYSLQFFNLYTENNRYCTLFEYVYATT